MSDAERATSEFRVAWEGSDIVVRFPAELLSEDEATEICDYFFLEYVARESTLTDAQISELAAEVKRGVWNRLRPMVEAKLHDAGFHDSATGVTVDSPAGSSVPTGSPGKR